jgi:GNAT superfamily N-acetyltransferase
MIDARQYAETESLRNGLNICVRASRPDDVERVIEAFNLLEPESIYLRFFGPKKGFLPADIQRFCETDFQSRVILLCTLMQDDHEIVIASGTYARVGEDAAEVAFIVEEDYHRLGIAGRLLKHLGNIAVAAGVKIFLAEVLPHNNAMLGVFKRCGWPMTSETSDGTVHLSLTLKS